MNDQQKKQPPAKQTNEERALVVIDEGLKAYEPEFARLLGQSVDPAVFTAVAYEAFRHNRDLLEVALTAPDSIMKALHDAAALKLVPNGVLGSAYIVPRKNKTTGRREAYFQIGYRGLTELAMRSGHVKNVQSRIVYQNEPFRIVYGTSPRIEHEPLLDGADRGKVRGAYAVGQMRDGSTVIDYMTVDQINSIRDRSPSKSGPWSTDYEEMARKTVVRRLCKALPLSIEVQNAIALDDQGEGGEGVVAAAVTVEPSGSLAERIRTMTGTTTEAIEQKSEPKDVTPTATVESGPIDMKKASAETAPEGQETGQDAADEPEPSNDTPDDEPPADGAPDEPKKYGTAAGAKQSWNGQIEPQKTGVKLHTESWKAKIVADPDEPEVQAWIDSVTGGDTWYEVTVAGSLELVPWERDGRAMPPYRKITVAAIEVHRPVTS